MVVKKAISIFSELGKTTFSNGVSTCKSAISTINSLMPSKFSEGKFKALLKSALKPQEFLTKERLMNYKETLLSKCGMEDDSGRICCPKCGSVLPSYYIFCFDCGTQLFDDILCSSSKESTKNFFKSITSLLDLSLLHDNVRLLLYLLKKLDNCVFPLARLAYRI